MWATCYGLRMTQPIDKRSYTLDDELLRTMDHRKRNQLLGCMHAHNELTFLNRMLVFSQTPVTDGALHDQAQSSQMWCLLQLLAGKLYETWKMLAKRFSVSEKAGKQDAVVTALDAQQREGLIWLREYFSGKGANDKPIVMLRNNTAFHYGGLDMGQAVKNLAAEEKTFHIADHPVNTLYWIGSAVVFGTIFAEIALKANPADTRSHVELVQVGLDLLLRDVNQANFYLPQLLFGLIKGLLEDALGQPLGAGDVTTIEGLQASRQIALCPWLENQRRAAHPHHLIVEGVFDGFSSRQRPLNGPSVEAAFPPSTCSHSLGSSLTQTTFS